MTLDQYPTEAHYGSPLLPGPDDGGAGERNQLVKNSAVYLAASTLSQVTGVARAMVLAVIFTPAQLGVWNLMNVILGYGGNAHLGILHSMNKTIPFLRGQGKLGQIETVKNSVFWVNMALGGIAAVILWGWAWSTDQEYKTAVRITGLTIFLLIVFSYLFSLLRADNRFMLTSKGVSVHGILSTVLVIAFVFIFRDPLTGALTGLLAAYAVVVAYWLWKGRYRFAFSVHLGTTRELFLAGVPLITIFIGEAILLSIDRWMVAAKLGETLLGHYAIGIMASSMIALVPSALASVLYTKMLERHGSVGDPTALRGLYAVPMRAMAAIMSLLIGGSVLLLPFLFRFFLPKYVPSIASLRILLVASFFYSSTFIPGSLLVSINRQRWMLLIQVLLIPLALFLYTFAIDKGWGIIGVAGSSAVIYACFGFGYLFCAAYYVFERRMDLIRFIADILGIIAVMVAALVLSILVVPDGAGLAAASGFLALRVTVFGAVLLPVLWWLNRDGAIAGILREYLIGRWTIKQR